MLTVCLRLLNTPDFQRARFSIYRLCLILLHFGLEAKKTIVHKSIKKKQQKKKKEEEAEEEEEKKKKKKKKRNISPHARLSV